jgi:hypothetical protein
VFGTVRRTFSLGIRPIRHRTVTYSVGAALALAVAVGQRRLAEVRTVQRPVLQKDRDGYSATMIWVPGYRLRGAYCMLTY